MQDIQRGCSWTPWLLVFIEDLSKELVEEVWRVIFYKEEITGVEKGDDVGMNNVFLENFLAQYALCAAPKNKATYLNEVPTSIK